MSKRWMRFSVSTLLLMMTIACIWLGVLGVRMNRANLQRKVVKAVQEAGGEVLYEHEQNPRGMGGPARPKPGILERLFGIDFAHSVVQVSLTEKTQGVDDLLPDICRLSNLEKLIVGGDVSDAGTKHLSRCKNLTHFIACDAEITDKTLRVLGEVRSLRYLDLAATKITNDGLKHLAPLTELEQLHLWGKEIADDAMPHISLLKGLKQLHIQHCSVTTEGLHHVTKLPNLEALNIAPAKLDDSAVEIFKELDKLTWLVLAGTEISDAAIQVLKTAKPKLSVH